MNPHWSDESLGALLRHFNNGVSDRAIGHYIGRSKQAVSAKRAELGLRRDAPPSHEPDPELAILGDIAHVSRVMAAGGFRSFVPCTSQAPLAPRLKTAGGWR